MTLLANAALAAAGSASPAAIVAAAAAAAQTPPAEANAPAAPAAPAPAPAPAAAAPAAALDASAIRAEARSAERERIKAIIAHPEAEGRSALAQQLAFGTDLAPDAAGSLLTTAPKAEAIRTLTGATVPQPNVAPQAGANQPADAKSRLAAARMAVTGQKA